MRLLALAAESFASDTLLQIVGIEGYSEKALLLSADVAFQCMRVLQAFGEEMFADFGFEKLDRALRYLAATPFVARGKGMRGAPNANQLPTNLIMMKGLDVLGCPTVISTIHDPSLRPPRLAYVLAWAAEGTLRPHLSHVFPLAEFREAMQAKWRGEVIGGCVLRP